jgi:alpha-glucosidase
MLLVSSPDGTLDVRLSVESGEARYAVARFGRDVIAPSRLGLVLREGSLASGLVLDGHERRSADETWTTVWGESDTVRDRHEELAVALRQEASGRLLRVVFRVFDDGVGFRYEIPEQGGLTDLEITDERTQFAFVEDAAAWWIGAYQKNRYEYLYRRSPLSELGVVHTPLTLETEDGLCLSVHEAALTDFAAMTLVRTEGTTLKADLVPWAAGTKVKARAPVTSPWRTVQVADGPGGLITSRLILNLNEPCRLEDTSWIRPGKYVGIWWEMHLGKSTWGSGERHGATTANALRYLDFAARHGLDGVLVEGWNLGWDGDWYRDGSGFDFTAPHPDFDLEEVARHARDVGVSLIGHHETGADVANYERQMEDAFALCERLGIHAVKTGYVGNDPEVVGPDGGPGEWHHGQFMVRHYRRVVEEAARHRVMLDVHEPVKDTGIRRTWPNMMTREGARGQEYNAWSPDGGNPPEHETILPFTRGLAGPFDFTPGIFDLLFEEQRPENRVNTTIVKQLALYVVLYSPLQMAADLPESYEARPELFRFVEDVPTDWSETVVPHARIGDYVTIARRVRGGDDWWVGSVTDENGRVLEMPLGFLDGGRRYVARIWRDGPDADWNERPYDHEIEERLVDAGTVLTLRLAPGGGQAIRLTPAGADDVRRPEGGR